MNVVTLDAYPGLERLRLAVAGDIIRSEVKRSEGGVLMRLVDPVLAIECPGLNFAAIHPDILALIGVLAFHPAFPEGEFELRTNFPVSHNVERALRRPWILEGVTIRGTGCAQSYVARRHSVLSYGGGLDSLSAHVMFPGAVLVHETPLPARGAFYMDVVNGLVGCLGAESHQVHDNLRQLFTAWGLPLWVSVYIAALILEPRYILSGSELTGTYLLGGQRYHPRHRNLWYRVFEEIGVTILPTSFLSEIGNARLVDAHGLMDKAAYCAFIDRQDCDKCTKCLRRRMIRGMLNDSDLALVDSFTRTEAVNKFLATRPLYYGDVFVHAAISQARPTWVSDLLSDLTRQHGRLRFHDAYYPDAFDHFGYPTSMRAQAEKVLRGIGMHSFNDADRRQFTTYAQVAVESLPT